MVTRCSATWSLTHSIDKRLEEQSPPASDFQALSPKIRYDGRADEILRELILPALERSTQYDRVSNDFAASVSLLPLAQGIEALWRKRGRMRLLLAIQDVPEHLIEASLTPDEWVARLIAAVRARLLAKVSTVADELARDQLATLAWMIQDGLLEVRLAIPRGPAEIQSARAMFQNRRYILEDASSNRMVLIGNASEPVMGVGNDFSDLTVYSSWNDPQGYVASYVEEFSRLWDQQHPALQVRALDQEFANDLLRQLGRRPAGLGVRETLAHKLIVAARKSPSFIPFNLGHAALYPHQERALVDGLSRWPVRLLLADEVGLGKTLEAGAIIAYLVRYGGVGRVTILAPKNVLKQWQSELQRHFGLDFWRYESGSRALVSARDRIWTVRRHGDIFARQAPSLLIVSAQLARGRRRDGNLFRGAEVKPDLLVVDEAHAARTKPEDNGSKHPTLLWRTIDEIAPQVPHLLLLTATPVQMHWEELHALLAFVGLPSAWADPARYQRSLQILASAGSASLQDARIALELIASSAAELDWRPTDLDAAEREVFELATSSSGSPTTTQCIRARDRWADTFRVLVRAHPGQLLAIRHSRSALERLGYRFPRRELVVPQLEVTDEVTEFYEAVDEYLRGAYGQVEKALDPRVGSNLGFARSAYHQRLVSSLEAARLTLSRRIGRIEALQAGLGLPPIVEDEAQEDEGEIGELAITRVAGTRTGGAVAHACAIELGWLKDLLKQNEALRSLGVWSDPKLRQMLSTIDEHLPTSRVLVFSRYTDTLDACIEAFVSHAGHSLGGYGKYTGSESWVDIDGTRLPADKETVRAALDAGDIQVAFCSDAASEGLNLQSARVLINIDVPWNPARLEQRIGRIDRIGQTADVVHVYNLWYPDSVEAKMYSRLIARSDLYKLAVGEFPDVVSRAIRGELAARFSVGASAIVADPLEVLQELRQQDQHRAMRQIWSFDLDPYPAAQQFRQGLVELLATAVPSASSVEGKRGSTPSAEPGLPNSISLLEEALDSLPSFHGQGTNSTSVSVMRSGSDPIAFSVGLPGNEVMVPPEAFPTLLAAAAGVRLWDQSLASNDGVPYSQRWLPDHGRRRSLVPDGEWSVAVPDLPSQPLLVSEVIGSVPVAEK